MKALSFLFLLALIPTTLYQNSYSLSSNLYGLWIDHYSDTKLEIKSNRKGIRVREYRGSKKKKWRTYYKMGYGLYDDCKGKVILVHGRGQIEWRKSRRKSIYLQPYGDYGYDRGYRSDRRDRYDQYDWRDGYDRRRSNSRDRYRGDWYCSDYGLELNIESYRDGFRARRPNGDWTYYNSYQDGFRDRRGNSYFFEGDRLIWRSADKKRRYSFNKR